MKTAVYALIVLGISLLAAIAGVLLYRRKTGAKNKSPDSLRQSARATKAS